MVTSEFPLQDSAQSPARDRLSAIIGFVARRIAQFRRTIQNRRAVGQLLQWDSRMLNDIGLTRGDVLSALAEPIIADPAHRLKTLSAERRAGIRATVRESRDYVAATRQPRPEAAERRFRVIEI